jgi:hypothetical protein
MEGKVNGALRAYVGIQPCGSKPSSRSRSCSPEQLVATFTKNIAITGKLDGTLQTSSPRGPMPRLCSAAPSVKGRFRLSDGSLSNVDLVAVMQSDAAGQRAGVTKFAELTGELSSADQRSSFRQVNLQGGVLRGTGNFDVGSNGSLAGRASLEIRSQVAQDRGSFGISGTVSRPIIKRGG